MGIDYGSKRVGLAVTDPLQIIVTGLTTIGTKDIFDYLKEYFLREDVELIVVGEPFYPDGNPSQIHTKVIGFIDQLQKKWPAIPIVKQDESYTSKRAREIILQSGAKKKKRMDRALVDQIAAVLILEDYLGISDDR